MRSRILAFSLLSVVLVFLAAGIAYNLPPIHERLAWRVENLRTQIRYALKPPQQAVFVPQKQVDVQVEAIVQATLQALRSTPAAPASPLNPSATQPATQAGPTSTPALSPTPSAIPTPIPQKVLLKGAVHEYQQFNNCGPATLAVALSYWGWAGDQTKTRTYLRPNPKVDDKNVNPFELVNYVETQTQFKALTRVGGDLDLLKRLVAAGFPVIIEKGFQPAKEDWMGHYELVTGYDDARARLITQDVYIMPDFPLPYPEVTDHWWRDFNYSYVVVYPAEREASLMAVLGPQADPAANYRYAAQKAADETAALTGRDLFFAWYNLGSSRVGLQDYAGAAEAYDKAFNLYPSISEKERPWRMLWYQVGPYPAYYNTGRYQDLIDLTNFAFAALDQPTLEESLYWRGLAREALGKLDEAISDLKQAYALNPNSTPALDELKKLGVDNPAN